MWVRPYGNLDDEGLIEHAELMDNDDVIISEDSQKESDLKIKFMLDPYPYDQLEEFFEMAKEVGSLKLSLQSKIKEIYSNNIIEDKDLAFFIDRNILDDTRKKALEIINKFKTEV